MRRSSLLWHRKQIALRKLFAFVLCFSFILTPLEIAFAQDAGTGTAATDSGSNTPPPTPSPTPTPPPSADFSIPGVDSSAPSSNASTDVVPPDSTAPASPTTGSAPTGNSSAPATDSTSPTYGTANKPTTPPPTPPAPSGFGTNSTPTILNAFSYQNTTPKADGSTGALTQTIRLDVPPGRNGMQPDLALKYNSQNAQDSIVGYLKVTIFPLQRCRFMEHLQGQMLFQTLLSGFTRLIPAQTRR